MAQPQRLCLPGQEQRSFGQGGGFDFFDQVSLATRLQSRHQFGLVIKMLFQHFLGPASDENEFFDPGVAGFVNRVLDQGAIHQRQHFLGHHLGRG